jgi:glutathione synthase
MPLTVAVQMDPIETINIAGDSTFALMLEAQRRGHALMTYGPDALSLVHGEVFATVRRCHIRDHVGDHVTQEAPERIALSHADVVLMRQDPPFDMGYITATHILEYLPSGTLVVNNPAHVRNAPEKLFVLSFPDLMPPTLISRDKAEIERFRNAHGAVVMKPLYGNGGAAVFKVDLDDPNFGSLFDLFCVTFKEPWVIQKFLPEITAGDKRIILIDGEAAGALNRVPAQGDIRANLVRGGAAKPTDLTLREQEICARIGPALRERGLLFVGIDVIDGWMTEINVTSPTGLRAIHRLGGPDLSVMIWDVIEAKQKAKRLDI